MTGSGGALHAPAVPVAPVAPGEGRLIDPTLFIEVDDALRLVGSKCDDCATVTFPAQGSCPRCAGQRVHRHALAARGVLWAFTVQAFPPKPPYLGAQSRFLPYGVGYVDLGGEVMVESRLLVTAVDELRVGLPMRLALEQLPGDTDDPIWTFAFTADLTTIETGTVEPVVTDQGEAS